MKKSLLIIFSLLFSQLVAAQQIQQVGFPNENSKPPFTVTGKVFDSSTGDGLPGANVFIERQNIGTSADVDGNYSLELYEGLYTIQVSSTGYETVTKRVNVLNDGKLNFILTVKITELSEVVIEGAAEKRDFVNKDVGTEVLTISSIKTLPPLGGEADIIKSLTLLPGVSTPGEASSGFNVRGGGFDQNLILMDGAALYNPSHMFGFFSAFNPNMIRDVTLYKGAIPATYGGRGSSVVDITYQKGNLSYWTGDVTLGVLSSKFSAGGPIVPGKISVNMGGRASYTNWLLRKAKDPDVHNSGANFYDGNVVLSYAINPNNDLEYSLYYSNDDFRFAGDTTNQWQNTAQVLKWTSIFNEQLSLQVSGVQSLYRSTILDDARFASFKQKTGITDLSGTATLTYKPTDSHTIKVGGQMKRLSVDLGTLTPGENTPIEPVDIPSEKAMESGVYFQHQYSIFDNLELSYGLRWSNFRLLGSGTINTYDPNGERSIVNVTGQEVFGDNDVIQDYNGLEPRAGINFKVNEENSIKFGYNRMYQYIHLISNTTSISPIDVWKLSDPFLEPEIVTQYSLGFFRNLQHGRFEASIEGFYKDWDNVVEYKDGARLFLNDNLETELLTGKGRSYGVEAYFKKNIGRYSGWLSYTYARSLRKVQGEFDRETINGGDWYPSNFDKPSNFTAVNRFRLGAYATMSWIFTFSTGRPVTLPTGKFRYQRTILGYFDERNNGRIPDYHRLDFSLQFRWPSQKKLLAGEWTLSIYNLYGRENAFSVFFRDTFGAPPQAFKVSVVGAPFPSISYELKF